jgi:tetraacyldisaccharide 4'-kinase
VLISDDGLQHYRLQREMEIAVADAALRLDRARMLPAGPLREPVGRLQEVDAVVVNGDNPMSGAHTMRLTGQVFYNLANPQLTAKPEDFKRKTVKAMAGIGNPERFFNHLRNIGLNFAGVSFDDHHPFTAQDLAGLDCDVLIMTEKDAVKCKPYAQPHHWVLPVEAEISGDLLAKVLKILKKGSQTHG